MTDLEAQLADHRVALDEFMAAARSLDAATWAAPRAPGAWSPAQIAEHLAVINEYNRTVATGTAPHPIPRLAEPVVHWIARTAFLRPTLRAGRFTRKGRAPAFMQPSAAPPAADVVLARLGAAVSGLERDVRSLETVTHPLLGTIPTVDWMRLQAIHVRHHCAQLPVAATSGRG